MASRIIDEMMKAIALISGGLDSILAAKLIQAQGIEVIGVYFENTFARRKKEILGSIRNFASELTSNLGIELKTIDIGNEVLEILKSPKYGYGSAMNPCIDCRILMLKESKQIMRDRNAAFVVSGEVLGQRPMSQHKQAMLNIARESGLEGLLLRPLSARLLPRTIPEEQGWVERDKLFDFNGRSRKAQIELARNLNLRDYPNSGGGCLLTEPLFVNKLTDLLRYDELNLGNIELIKIGRHFRISPFAKLAVGRDEEENKALESLARDKDYLFLPTDELAGPTSLGRGVFNEEAIRLSCRITCGYCDLDGVNSADIVYQMISQKQTDVLTVSPIEADVLRRFRI
ncbi:MAG: tRNA 4-thiouridine(8) synthase ThiI [Candidatus Omnitrophota bacterium]